MFTRPTSYNIFCGPLEATVCLQERHAGGEEEDFVQEAQRQRGWRRDRGSSQRPRRRQEQEKQEEEESQGNSVMDSGRAHQE